MAAYSIDLRLRVLRDADAGLPSARCRTREVLWHTIGTAVPGYDPAECRNYFRHCGYSVATTS